MWGWRAAGTRERLSAGEVGRARAPPPGPTRGRLPVAPLPAPACARLPPLDHGVPNLRLGATQRLESFKVGLLFFLSPGCPSSPPSCSRPPRSRCRRSRPRGAGGGTGGLAAPCAQPRRTGGAGRPPVQEGGRGSGTRPCSRSGGRHRLPRRPRAHARACAPSALRASRDVPDSPPGLS